MRKMTLGSLFDGSGGFPLAGTINGIKPLWASEIEPYPIRVTKARFPEMKHLGSVLDIKGSEIEPVDIITFGSPCQDLSVAGRQKGIHEGERSSLFFEAVRIAKEMRDHDRATGRADVDLRPRFLVWENVPGAFSSNQGEDFRAVLEAIGGVAEDGVSIPRPPKGKWEHAGCVVGDGWSIAWRLYDAQYWGVPQRRKRIYLVADLASERAGEILFEREGLCGYPAEGGEAWEGIADHAEGSAGGSCEFCFPLNEQVILRHNKLGRATGFGAGLDGDPAYTLQANHPHMIAAGFVGRQGAKSGSVGYETNKAPTLRQGITSDVVYPSDAGFSDTIGEKAQGGRPWSVGAAYTLNTIDRHAVGYQEKVGALCAADWRGANSQYVQSDKLVVQPLCTDARGNGDGLHATTLTGDHQNRVTDYTVICVHDMRAFGDSERRVSDYSNVVAYGGDKAGTLDASYYKGAGERNGKERESLAEAKPGHKYIVRRLTPLECCRLQGFPDWWEDGVEGSDSARYKMWGNGIALPCAADVLKRISEKS